MLIQRIGIAIVLALTLTAFRDSLRVDSRTISPGTAEQLSITGGVLTIAPGDETDSIMEIGNNGNEIISTGDINIRPNGSPVGTRFVGNIDGTQDLLLTGKFDVQGSITLGGVTRTTWPYVDNWKTIQNTEGNTTLTPSETMFNLLVGLQQTRDTAIAGLSLYSSAGTGYSALNVSNTGTGSLAADFNDTNVLIYGDLGYYNLYVCGSTETTAAERAQECHENRSLYKLGWTKSNIHDQGGVDADYVGGVDTYFVGDCNGQAGAVCLCTSMPDSTSRCRILTTPVYDVP